MNFTDSPRNCEVDYQSGSFVNRSQISRQSRRCTDGDEVRLDPARLNQSRIKVAIAHPRIARGGSEARAFWGIQALCEQCDVSLITTAEFDLADVNDFYRTTLDADDFHLRLAPPPFGLRRAFDAASLRGCLFQKFCRSIAHEFDVMISVYNPCDFGVPAIQFIADFSWDDRLRNQFDPRPRHNPIRSAYLSLSRAAANPSGRNLFNGEDKIVANSKWTARIMKQRFGADCEIIYPPVASEINPAQRSREMGFVCVGRISYEKRIETIIEILSRVRKLGHDIHLHIAGLIGDSPYGTMIKNLCQKNAAWIFREGQKSGEAKMELLAKHRFGIHGRPNEAFGIAVAEMAKAGCITFVPDSGGQIEIIDLPGLRYRNIDDAVKQIDAIIRDEKLQQKMSERLQKRGQFFSAERFMSDFKNVVDRFAERNAWPIAS